MLQGGISTSPGGIWSCNGSSTQRASPHRSLYQSAALAVQHDVQTSSVQDAGPHNAQIETPSMRASSPLSSAMDARGDKCVTSVWPTMVADTACCTTLEFSAAADAVQHNAHDRSGPPRARSRARGVHPRRRAGSSCTIGSASCCRVQNNAQLTRIPSPYVTCARPPRDRRIHLRSERHRRRRSRFGRRCSTRPGR